MKYLIQTIYTIAFVGIFALGFGQAYAFSASEVVNLANSSRNQNGLGALETNAKLTDAALSKANDMLSNDYFAHTSPSGKTPWDFILAAGYNYNYAGENLAIGYTDAQELQNDWMNSPSHRANILNENFREIGVAIVYGEYKGSQTAVVVQTFGAINPGVVEVPAKVESITDTHTNIENDLNKEDAPQEPVKVAEEPKIHEKEFTINKDKTGYEPKKIFSGEKITFRVTLNGSIQSLVLDIDGTKINLAESSSSQQENGEKTFSKEVSLDKTGNFSVILTAQDKWGNTETVNLGSVIVVKKDIVKNVNGSLAGGLNLVKDLHINPAYLVTILGLLVLALGVYLVIVLRRNHKIA